jgi:hypothetical protein
MAAKLEAQAASVMKLGPRRLSRLATRPETMLGSSPGMESSVMAGMRWSMTLCHSAMICWRRSGESRLKASEACSAWANSGKTMRFWVV